MEREDRRMGQLAAAGKHPDLVMWGKRSNEILGWEGKPRPGEPLEHPSNPPLEPREPGIVAWFTRLSPDAVQDSWAVHALLEPSSDEAEEARTMRSAQSARSRSRPGTALVANALARTGSPAAQSTGALPPIHTGPSKRVDTAEAPRIDRKRLAAMSPMKRAHIRAAEAVRTDAFTVMKRHLPAPVHGVRTHSFGVGLDTQVADRGAGPTASGPPALAAEDQYAPEQEGPQIEQAGGHGESEGFAGGWFGESASGASPHSHGVPRLQLDGVDGGGLQSEGKSFQGSKAKWPQSDLHSSRAKAQGGGSGTDHDVLFSKDKRFNQQGFQNGYSIGEVLDFAMLRAAFLHHACEEWARNGGDHMDGKLNVRQFVDAVRKRC